MYTKTHKLYTAGIYLLRRGERKMHQDLRELQSPADTIRGDNVGIGYLCWCLSIRNADFSRKIYVHK